MNPGGQTSVDYPGGIHHSDFTGPGMQTLFSPTHVVPDCTYHRDEPVCIIGKFLISPEDVQKHTWTCLFGNVEVPANVIAKGVLQCRAPLHEIGIVPLRIKCSNGLSCPAGKYEFRDIKDLERNCFIFRLQKMLYTSPSYIENCSTKMFEQCVTVSKLLELDSNDQSQNLLKKSLRNWLLHKIVENGGDANIPDVKGQGVLHLFAALGFDWAIKAIFESGVINIDSRNEVVKLLESYGERAGESISTYPSIVNQDNKLTFVEDYMEQEGFVSSTSNEQALAGAYMQQPPARSSGCHPPCKKLCITPAGQLLQSDVETSSLIYQSSNYPFSTTAIIPSWIFSAVQIEVCVVGKFLMSREEVQKHTWSCLFGNVEVPANLIAEGVLQCVTPLHEIGIVPLYIKCSNGLSCPAGKFEFRFLPRNHFERIGFILILEKLLYTSPSPIEIENCSTKTFEQCANVSKLLEIDSNDQSIQNLLRKALRNWLLHKIVQSGLQSGGDVNILDAKGQGVPHLFGALGFDWAIKPIFESGVISIDFVDANGFTTLDWAKLYCRNDVVKLLESYGATREHAGESIYAPPSVVNQGNILFEDALKLSEYSSESSCNGNPHVEDDSDCLSSKRLLVDERRHIDFDIIGNLDSCTSNELEDTLEKTIQPCLDAQADGSEDGNERTPEGVTFTSGHKGISGHVAESITLQVSSGSNQGKAVAMEQSATPVGYDEIGFGLSDDHALSLLLPDTERVHTAAVRIQNKFRSWKVRKEFLLTQKQIIKIQKGPSACKGTRGD